MCHETDNGRRTTATTDRRMSGGSRVTRRVASLLVNGFVPGLGGMIRPLLWRPIRFDAIGPERRGRWRGWDLYQRVRRRRGYNEHAAGSAGRAGKTGKTGTRTGAEHSVDDCDGPEGRNRVRKRTESKVGAVLVLVLCFVADGW